MNRIIIASDLHNTLVFSETAWIKAFKDQAPSDSDYIQNYLRKKGSRKQLALELGVSFDEVYTGYRKNLELNYRLIRVLREFSDKGIPIVIISSAPKYRVLNDLININKILRIDRICCKEDFKKDNTEDWNKLIDIYGCEYILYFGNDTYEDAIKHERIISAIITRDGDNAADEY